MLFCDKILPRLRKVSLTKFTISELQKSRLSLDCSKEIDASLNSLSPSSVHLDFCSTDMAGAVSFIPTGDVNQKAMEGIEACDGRRMKWTEQCKSKASVVNLQFNYSIWIQPLRKINNARLLRNMFPLYSADFFPHIW